MYKAYKIKNNQIKSNNLIINILTPPKMIL